MEERFVHSVNGQEVQQADVNMMAISALMDDRVFQELFRLPPPYLGAPARAVLRYDYPIFNANLNNPIERGKDIVCGNESADARVRVYRFRALIGSRTALNVDGVAAFKDVRSASNLVDLTAQEYETVQLAAATNNRWDLVWARVDIDVDQSAVTRYVKTTPGTGVATSISVSQKTTVTIGVTQGVEAGTPTRPAVPSDSGSSYYIPLAYVALAAGHTLATEIMAVQIHDVAPVITLSAATGGTTCRPGNQQYAAGGTILTATPWDAGGTRPSAYMPASMVGVETRMFAFTFDDAGSKHSFAADGNWHLIDSSLDWRWRIFWWFATFQALAGGYDFAWVPSISVAFPQTPDYPTAAAMGFGESFSNNIPLWLGSNSLVGMSNAILFKVGTNGYLYAKTNGATSPECKVFIVLNASGQFANAGSTLSDP